jgi:flagellar basal-body rod protein FlgB
MIKMSDARMSYDAAIGYYQKSMNLLRMAGRPPGRG